MDGGFGDADGAANWVIVDLSGIGTTAATPGANDPSDPDAATHTPDCETQPWDRGYQIGICHNGVINCNYSKL